MNSISNAIQLQSSDNAKKRLPRLLTVGPLPPPLTGSPVSFQIFCDEIQHGDRLESVTVVDASPRRLKQVTGTGFTLSPANIKQAVRIFWPYVRHLKQADCVLLFGSNGFVLSMGPLLMITAKLYGKPCYFRSFGGSLDQFCNNLPSVIRWGVFQGLRGFDGLIVETGLLYRYFVKLLGEDKVHYVPGYRPMEKADQASETTATKPHKQSTTLRLAFFGIIKDEKGVFYLLESLRKVEAELGDVVSCHIHGPIHEPAKDRFEAALAQTKSATYNGVVKHDEVISALKNYDVLVLPTYYQGEGHPGVLIEAMMAGIPVITSRFRAIPEIVEDGVNGLLAEPQNADSLAKAIKTLCENRALLATLAKNSIEMSKRYDAKNVVPMIIDALKIDRKS